MAILNFTGFELASGGELYDYNGATFVSNPDGSGYVCQCSPVGTGVAYARLGPIGADGTTTLTDNSLNLGNPCYVMFRMYVSSRPSSAEEEVFNVRHATGGYKLTLVMTSAGVLKLCTGSPPTFTTIWTASSATPLTTWVRIELLTNAVSTTELRIDGNTMYSGAATQPTTAAGVMIVGKYTNLNGGSYTIYYDDIVVDSAGFPGNLRVVGLTVNGNGADVGWNNGATIWQNIAEIPPDTAAYIDTASTGVRQGAALISAATAGVPAGQSIISAKLVFSMGRTGNRAATCNVGFRSGSSFSNTTVDFSTTSTPTSLSWVANTDPATSAAWTSSGIDGMEANAYSTSTRGCRWHQVTGQVLYDATVATSWAPLSSSAFMVFVP